VIRVLEVLASLKRAGAERMATTLACRLDKTRFQVGVVSLFDAFPGGFEPDLAVCGIQVSHLGKRPGLDVRMWPRLSRAVRSFRPAVVHTHSYVLRYAWPAAVAAGRPRIVHTVHNLASQEVDRAGRMIHHLAFRAGVVPVAVAEEVARSFRDLYGFPPAATIPNGIDTAHFRKTEARGAWRRANGFDAAELLILSVARLEPQKNPLLLAEAFERAGTGRLLVAGEGKLRPQLEGRERVHLLGARADVAEMLSACDIFALASDWEGHPLSVMEAMAAGLPVVATSVGGVPEIVGDAGVLVAPRDVEALSRAIRSLAGDCALREEMRRKAVARAESFDIAVMVDAYARLFDQVSK
jgi:glycosyltransferase involved in cell wall biosynthesis